MWQILVLTHLGVFSRHQGHRGQDDFSTRILNKWSLQQSSNFIHFQATKIQTSLFFVKHPHPSSQRQRNSNRGAKKRPPRRLRVAGCCSPSSRCNFQGIQGTLAHGDAELLLLFYKHTSEFRSEKERKTPKCWCREPLETKQSFLDWEIRSAHFKQRPISIISGR